MKGKPVAATAAAMAGVPSRARIPSPCQVFSQRCNRVPRSSGLKEIDQVPCSR